ncbi:MAG: hypothetical protein LLF96_08420, partial [Eubacteriales bacterium]|nr:hypothetical protein [Eubacteriales bacterium]
RLVHRNICSSVFACLIMLHSMQRGALIWSVYRKARKSCVSIVEKRLKSLDSSVGSDRLPVDGIC